MPVQRRQWFQLSLATCVEMMLVAAVLAWANLNRINENWPSNIHGWPLVCNSIPNQILIWGGFEMDPIGGSQPPHCILYGPLTINIFTALAVLALTATLSEYLIRRRSRTKQGLKG